MRQCPVLAGEMAKLFASPLCKRGKDCLPRRSVAKAGGEGISNSSLLTVARNPHLALSLFKEEVEDNAGGVVVKYSLSLPHCVASTVSASAGVSSFFGASVSFGAIGWWRCSQTKK